MPQETRIRVRTTNLFSVLIIICAMLYFLAFAIQNLAPALLAFLISLYLVYQRIAFGSKIKEADLRISRNILSKINFIGSPIAVKVGVSSNIPNINVTVEDVIPPGMSVARGSKKTSFVSGVKKKHSFSYTVKGERRGYYNFSDVQITLSDKRGFFKTVFIKQAAADILVHTDLDSIKQAKVLAKRHSLEMMDKTTTMMARSRSSEYEGVREFQYGDRLRDVDWKATSRLTKLMSRIFDAESTIPVTVLLDCSRSMRKTVLTSSKLDYGINSTIQLLKVLQSRGHPVGLITFDEHKVLNQVPPDVKADQYNVILELLKELPQTLSEESYGRKGPRYKLEKGRKLKKEEREFLKKVAPFVSRQSIDAEEGDRFRGIYLGVQRMLRQSQRSSLIILVTDLETDLKTVHSALKLARAKKNKVYVIAPYSPWFGLKKKDISVRILEDMYEEFLHKQDAETALRKIGVDVVNVGPKTPGATLLEGLRRYAT